MLMHLQNLLVTFRMCHSVRVAGAKSVYPVSWLPVFD